MSENLKKILPAEWFEQRFVQLTWPHAQTDWDYMLDEVTDCFINIAREIIKHEELLIVTPDPETIQSIFTPDELSNIKIVQMPTNDTWARDHAGISVYEDGEPVIYDFTFNGWGMKFPANFDNQITRNIFEHGYFPENFRYHNCLDFILEGGSIESNGAGVLLTTSQCLLSVNRNWSSKEEIEFRLKTYFNAEKILWLNHGYLSGDDTDSHVDTLARFCDSRTIAYVKCDNVQDEHFVELKKMESELLSFNDLNHVSFNLVSLPMADPIYELNERLPATYANFLIINGAVLMPTYHSDKDEIALIQLKKAFPDREIVGIDCRALIKQHGSLHCVTMQFPK